MKLLTESIKKQLLENGLSSDKAVCKLFNPCGGGTWIISGMDPEDNDTMWCLADIGCDCAEQGTVSLTELAELKLQFGLGIERDIHFDPKGRTLSDFYKLYEERGTLAGVS